MNWFCYTIIWQAILTIIPSLIIIMIFKFLNKKREKEDYEMEE